MRLTRSCFAVIGWSAFLAACREPAPADHRATATEAIRAADIAWEKAVSGHDTAMAVSMVEAGGSILAPNTPIATGPVAVRALFDGFYRIPGFEIDWVPRRVDAAQSGDLGYSTGAYQMTFTDAQGYKVADSGKYATVWRKQSDGSWKVVLDVFNTDVASTTE